MVVLLEKWTAATPTATANGSLSCGTWCSCSSTKTRNATARPSPLPAWTPAWDLERAAVILQGKNNIYETELFTPIIAKACQLTGREYGADIDTDFALRVIAEHARAAAFLIGDGVVPGNEGRGYVLRRVIRRAIRYGRRLGLTGPFLREVVEEVIPRFPGRLR